ncbi:MAG: hypothetical protein QM780_01175 [Hyphomicrobium sp.]|uniref:hypothetical protein n=1 Tax=Hyphomicrobium sp. TaxID=82 RepID=UPI0039E26209
MVKRGFAKFLGWLKWAALWASLTLFGKWLFEQVFGNFLTDFIVSTIGARFGIPEAQVTAIFMQIAIFGSAMGVALWGVYHLIRREFVQKHIGPSPLQFVQLSSEHDWFYGRPEGLEIRTFVRNARTSETIDDVEVRLIQVRDANSSVSSHLVLPALPITLASESGRESERIDPLRNKAFRLCRKIERNQGAFEIELAPGRSLGVHLSAGRYALTVIASGRNVLPRKGVYEVEISSDEGGTRSSFRLINAPNSEILGSLPIDRPP